MFTNPLKIYNQFSALQAGIFDSTNPVLKIIQWKFHQKITLRWSLQHQDHVPHMAMNTLPPWTQPCPTRLVIRMSSSHQKCPGRPPTCPRLKGMLKKHSRSPTIPLQHLTHITILYINFPFGKFKINQWRDVYKLTNTIYELTNIVFLL